MSLRRLPNRPQCGETMNSNRTDCSIAIDAVIIDMAARGCCFIRGEGKPLLRAQGEQGVESPSLGGYACVPLGSRLRSRACSRIVLRLEMSLIMLLTPFYSPVPLHILILCI